jgi:cytoskeletal protein RodZ
MMENPGEYLKRERELRGVSIEDVSGVIRVSIRLLEALEGDDYAVLPHPTYVRGFIRSYCRYLGLDENDAVLRYEVYLRDHPEQDKDRDAAEEEHKPRLSSNVVVGVFLAIGVLAVILSYILLRGGDREMVEPDEIVIPPPPAPEAVQGGGEGAAVVGEAPGEGSGGVILEKVYTLQVNATADAWIRVVIDNADPLEVLLHEGDSVSWEAERVFFC